MNARTPRARCAFTIPHSTSPSRLSDSFVSAILVQSAHPYLLIPRFVNDANQKADRGVHHMCRGPSGKPGESIINRMEVPRYDLLNGLRCSRSNDTVQSQTSMQFTSPLPEHHVLPLATPPVPTSAPPTVYTDPYAVGSGEPLYSHLNNVTYVQQEYLDFANAGDSLQMYTGGPHHSGVLPADEYSGMGT